MYRLFKLKFNFIIPIFMAIFTMVFILLLSSCSKGSESNDNYLDSARSIKVVQIEGKATVSDEKETIDCFCGMNLYDGDSLNVLDESTLVVRFDEDKYVYLGSNTKIKIKSDGTDKFKTNIFVEVGKVLAEIQNKLGEDEEFFLSSNNAVMAVRGTVFGVNVKDLGDNYSIAYSIYKGVTELYTFDTLNGELVSGKLSDLTNKKLELTVPKSHVLSSDNLSNVLDNWLSDINQKFDNEEDANSKLDEVNITVSNPTKSDYDEVMNVIQNETITYSDIIYNATGYFDKYDGLSHKISVNVDTPNAKVYYKGENETEYKETNDYEFINVGTYRVYYKIVCEGYNDKEDFEVIQISKAKLDISYKEELNIDKKLIPGMPLDYVFKDINLFDYVDIKGAESENQIIKNDSRFDFSGKLISGNNKYNIKINLPDDIKDNYFDSNLEFNLNVDELTLKSTDSIMDMGYPVLYLSNHNTFNRYNGIDSNSLFNNPVLGLGIDTITNSDCNIQFIFDSIVDGYYELNDGINEVSVKLTFDEFVINTNLEFYFNDQREEFDLDLSIDDSMVEDLGNDNYWFKAYDMPEEGNYFKINGNYLLEKFGVNNLAYINLPTELLDDDSINYSSSGTINFLNDEISKVEFLIFPTSEIKGSSKTIYAYFSLSAPTNYPTYNIKDDLEYLIGENFDFIDSTYDVSYSLDGINYSNTLSSSDSGNIEVYYKVGNELAIKSSIIIKVIKNEITSDNLKLLSENMSLLSNDNHSYYTVIPTSEMSVTADVISNNGEIFSPLDSVYELYTNIILNSEYYDSLTKDRIYPNINISEKENNSANFTYKLELDGYDTITKTITFNYASTEGLIETGKYTNGSIIYYPEDVTISLSLIDEYFASEISISSEDDYNHDIIYSIDNGLTWTNEIPSFTSVGEYTVYSIYSYTPSTTTNYLIAIQHITIVM